MTGACACGAEGVLYAKKDYNLPKHPEIDVPNLQVIKLMQSFKSKEYVRECFAWRHYYWSVPTLLASPTPPAPMTFIDACTRKGQQMLPWFVNRVVSVCRTRYMLPPE